MEEKLEIDVSRLKPGGETLEGVLDDAVLELADDELLNPFGGIRYSLDVQLLGRELLARGRLEQDFDAVCCRCGADFDFTAKVPDFTACVEAGEKIEIVDLTDEIRQSIILALPTYPVCSPACRGVCPACGKNLNEGSCGCVRDVHDERWGVLDGFELERK